MHLLRSLHLRHRQLPSDHRAGIELVDAGLFAQSIQIDVALQVTGEGKTTAWVQQRLEAQLELGGFRVHGVSPLGFADTLSVWFGVLDRT